MFDFNQRLNSFPPLVQNFIKEPYIENISLHNIDVDSKCTFDDTPVLTMICMYSHAFNPLRYFYYIPHALEKIEWLLSTGGADPNITDTVGGLTPLIYATIYSHPRNNLRKQCIDYTLKKYKIHLVKQKINKHMSFMIIAYIDDIKNYFNDDGFCNSSFRTVKLLLRYGANPNIQDNIYGWTALMYAVCHSSEKNVKILLAANADTNIQTYDGYTALRYANLMYPDNIDKSEKTKIIKRLLKAGANTDIIYGWDRSHYKIVIPDEVLKKNEIVKLLC